MIRSHDGEDEEGGQVDDDDEDDDDETDGPVIATGGKAMAECASGSERADVMIARWVKVTRSNNYVHGCEWGPRARGSGVDVRIVGGGQGSKRRGGDADDHEGVKVIARRRGGEPYREKRGAPFGRVSGLRGL